MKQILKLFSILTLLTLGAYAFNYSSVWINENPNARGIKKLNIQNNGIVKAFGSCQTGNCNWGGAEYTRTNSGLLASWKLSGRGYKVVLVEKVSGNRIKVITKHLRNAQRRDRTTISYFKTKHNVGHFARAFDGEWVNKEMRGRGLGRLSIQRSKGRSIVHAWGQGYQKDSDWGRFVATETRHKLTVVWNQNHRRKVMTIKGIERNRYGRFQTLEVKIQTYSRDRRGPKTRTFYLRRKHR